MMTLTRSTEEIRYELEVNVELGVGVKMVFPQPVLFLTSGDLGSAEVSWLCFLSDFW